MLSSRGASAAARAATRRPVSPRVIRTPQRWNSSQANPTPDPGQHHQQQSRLQLGRAAALLVAGASGYYLFKTATKKIGSAATLSDAPTFFETATDGDIPVASPIKVLDLKECNARIREQARSFAFQSIDGAKGRVDLVRLASNNPVEDEWAIGVGKGIGGASFANTLYTGVYDGHAGWATSAVLKQALIPYVSSALSQLSRSAPGDVVDTAIKAAFKRLDDRILTQATTALNAGHGPGNAEVIAAVAPAIAGSCALLTIFDPASSILKTAITGDCRAVLGSWSAQRGDFSADQLSQDQTGFNQDEVNRLSNDHPGEKDDILNPKSGRLMGLAVTRAFGDHRWKFTDELIKSIQANYFGYAPRPSNKTPPYLTASPEVTTRQVKSEDFVILASDGLWDQISSEDAVACVSRWLTAKRTGTAEPVTDAPGSFTLNDNNEASWRATPDMFAIEDLDSAAVCLLKNALGGRRREMFRGAVTAYSPLSRYVRDDVTVQVVFFKDPHTT